MEKIKTFIGNDFFPFKDEKPDENIIRACSMKSKLYNMITDKSDFKRINGINTNIDTYEDDFKKVLYNKSINKYKNKGSDIFGSWKELIRGAKYVIGTIVQSYIYLTAISKQNEDTL